MSQTASNTIKTGTKGNNTTKLPGVKGASVIKVSPMVINEGSTKVR